jgi:arsenate reductase
VGIAEELGVDYDVVVYRKEPPDEATLRDIIAKLEDPPTDLVRRDSLFKKLELSDDDVQSVDQIVATILANKMIMQRPVVVTKDKAIIGRPKDRIRELLGG